MSFLILLIEHAVLHHVVSYQHWAGLIYKLHWLQATVLRIRIYVILLGVSPVTIAILVSPRRPNSVGKCSVAQLLATWRCALVCHWKLAVHIRVEGRVYERLETVCHLSFCSSALKSHSRCSWSPCSHATGSLA